MCFYFQPRAWHTVGARGGLIVDPGSCVQLEAGHGVAQSGSLASSSDHTFVLQASESMSICVFSRWGPEHGEEGQGHGELGRGAVQGLDRGQDRGGGHRAWPERAGPNTPGLHRRSPGGPAFQETRPVHGRLTGLSKQRNCWQRVSSTHPRRMEATTPRSLLSLEVKSMGSELGCKS